MRRVGAHIAVGGGLARTLERVEQRRRDALQIFASNPRGWAVAAVDEGADERMRSALAERHWPLFLHAPYLVNLASPDDLVWKRSAENLSSAMARGERLGAASVIVHAGHAVGGARAQAMKRLVAALLVLLDRHPGVDVAIEPTAGAPSCIAGSVDQMAEVLDALDHHPRIRFCPDTCHLWAAGTDYSRDAVLKALRRGLADLGADRLVAVHLNDSKDPCGSCRDRHTNLGKGHIPLDALVRLVTCPELANAVVLLETPGPVQAQTADVTLARSWLRPGS